jgi:hypothetical protein
MSKATRVAAYRTELAAVEAQLLTLEKTGESVQVPGAYSAQTQLANLERRHARITRAILRAQGHTSRLTPDFGG